MSEPLDRDRLLNWLANVVGETVILEDMEPTQVAEVFREAADYLDEHGEEDIEHVISYFAHEEPRR